MLHCRISTISITCNADVPCAIAVQHTAFWRCKTAPWYPPTLQEVGVKKEIRKKKSVVPKLDSNSVPLTCEPKALPAELPGDRCGHSRYSACYIIYGAPRGDRLESDSARFLPRPQSYTRATWRAAYWGSSDHKTIDSSAMNGSERVIAIDT